MELAEVIGRLTELWRFPIEPMAGETPSEVVIRGEGVVGDRLYDVCDAETGEPLTASTAPLLLRYAAHYPGDHVPQDLGAWTRMRSPSGKDFLISDAEAVAEIGERVGRPVCLRPRARVSDGAPLHLLSRPTLRLLERTYGCPLEPARLRANLIVEITDGQAFDEDRWVGRRIRIGDALLEIVGPSSGCVVTTFCPEMASGDLELLSGLLQVRRHVGVSVRAVGGNRIRVSDSVILLD